MEKKYENMLISGHSSGFKVTNFVECMLCCPMKLMATENVLKYF